MAVADIHRPQRRCGSSHRAVAWCALLVGPVPWNRARTCAGRFSNELPAKAPSFYFLDIRGDCRPGPSPEFVRGLAPSATVKRSPCCGSASSRRRHAAEGLKPRDDAASVLQSDRGRILLEQQQITPHEGKWWENDCNQQPLVDCEKRIADGASPASWCQCDRGQHCRTQHNSNHRQPADGRWESLGINFVIAPICFQAAPHTHLATLRVSRGGGNCGAGSHRA